MSVSFAQLKPSIRLADQVAQQLESSIRDGRLKPGDKLPTEAALVAQMGVSRTVVREAISRLKSMGLVESRQGSGMYAKPVGVVPLSFDHEHLASQEAVIQLAEMRRALEAEVAALAATRRHAQHLVLLQEASQALDNAVAQGRDGVEEDLALHHQIALASGNPFLISTLEYLSQFLRAAIRVTRANESRRADFAQAVREEHAAIVQAIANSDPVAARSAASRHMDQAIKRTLQADPAFWDQEGARLAKPLIERNNGSLPPKISK